MNPPKQRSWYELRSHQDRRSRNPRPSGRGGCQGLGGRVPPPPNSEVAIKSRHGDILGIERGIIVHGCNCQGVMGAGLALAIRKKYPGVFGAYRARHTSQGLRLGEIQVVLSPADARKEWARRYSNVSGPEVTDNLPEGLVIVNAMTQGRYGRDGVFVDYDAVSACFFRVRMLAVDCGLPVYFPRVGCGLAGGDWLEVGRRISQALGPDVLERSALVDLPPASAESPSISSGQRANRSGAVCEARERWRRRAT